VSRRQRRACLSRLTLLLLHLLKWHYQPERQTPSWRRTIGEQRRQLTRLLRTAPSLGPQMPALLTASYPEARTKVSDETRLPVTTFPEICSWTTAQILDRDFWPE
jgi:Domain of unknown function DUF29